MKKYNFNAGPSILPREVIEQTAQAVQDFNGIGLSILEISHRSKDFQPVIPEAEALFKELLDIPEGYSVIFLGGGASLEFCMIPFNFLEKKAVYLNTGTWANKAMKEAKLFGEVAEVATRHRHHHLAHVVALFCQLSVCPEVIESLRKQSGYIHALGAGEQHFFRQFGVVERLHHYVFAVGERTVHLNGGDIATECGELCDLERSELPLRIEDINMCALNAVETVGDGTARMTGSDGNHIDFTTALLGGVVMCQQTRHEASANVLETHGRAMKQLQNVAIVAHVNERNGEIERFEHHIVKHLRVDVALQGVVGNGVTHLL